MNPTFREKLNYKLERFMSKGGSSIFMSLLVVFISSFLIIILIRFILIKFFPQLDYFDDFWSDIWITFLQMTDPGNMNQDNTSPTWLKITTVLSGIVGVILLSMLIAFITTTLEQMLYDFRKGRGKVIEEEHTLILGWNEKVVDIIRELVIANESERSASIVILSNEDKEIMDDLIAKRLPNTHSTKIITSTGDYANVNELNRVSVTKAKSVILLTTCSESSSAKDKMASDIQSVKSIMAIISCQQGENKLPIIAEIFNQEKRDLISYFHDDNIIAIDSWDIMGKLLVQTSLSSGLEMVYNEILSFDGCEIYFRSDNWNNIDFYDLPYHLKDGVPLGIYSEKKGLILRPDEGTILKNGAQVVILAEDDSTINFEKNAIITPNDIELADKRMKQKRKRVLILGWHNVASIFIRESVDYLLKGSVFDIMFNDPSEEITTVIEDTRKRYPNFEINFYNSNPLSLENLKAINPFDYDNIIILSQDYNEQSADKIDSDTLIILLLLRAISKENGGVKTNIITQVLNSENQDIITQTDVDDFIISNKLITMILAQLSEEPLIKTLYDDLFSEDGSEIYVKPAELYFTTFPQKICFADVMKLANKRNEICLGIRKGDLSKNPEVNFGVELNLAKNKMLEITENDYLVVLSEDEL